MGRIYFVHLEIHITDATIKMRPEQKQKQPNKHSAFFKHFLHHPRYPISQKPSNIFQKSQISIGACQFPLWAHPRRNICDMGFQTN